ncbi:Cytochrome c peroxidase, partial [Durusdinium trenchii]
RWVALVCTLVASWAREGWMASAATCSSCDADVSVAFLDGVVRPALVNYFYNSPGIPFERKLGGAIRGLFHDTGTFSAAAGDGGANGCLLDDDPANDGMNPVTEELSAVFEELPRREGFSRADLWQYAGLVATEISFSLALAEHDNVPALPDATRAFRYGRSDASGCGPLGMSLPSTTSIEFERGRLPAPEADFAGTIAAFERMGLTNREMVALSGAHSIGSATLDASGFDGKWVEKNAVLDNDYFVSLLDRTWFREVVRPSPNVLKNQWTTLENRELMMLNTDLSLVYQVSSGGGGCQQTGACRLNSNGDQLEARNIVIEYAGGVTRNRTAGLMAWYADFVPAMLKLGLLGYEDSLLEPCDLPADCTGGVPNNSSLTQVQLTLLFDDTYRPTYHGMAPFRSLLIDRIAIALDMSPSFIVVDSVVAGSVIATTRLFLDPNLDLKQLSALQTDNVVLQLMEEAFRSAVETRLVGRLVLARATLLGDAAAASLGLDESNPALFEVLAGPFQSDLFDQRNTLLGTAITAIALVVITSCLMACSYMDEESLDDVERQGKQAILRGGGATLVHR